LIVSAEVIEELLDPLSCRLTVAENRTADGSIRNADVYASISAVRYHHIGQVNSSIFQSAEKTTGIPVGLFSIGSVNLRDQPWYTNRLTMTVITANGIRAPSTDRDVAGLVRPFALISALEASAIGRKVFELAPILARIFRVRDSPGRYSVR
jgi:hypothetical protein